MIFLLLYGCTDKDIDCSTDSRSSVVVTMESETGIDGPTLFYTVGEDAPQEAESFQENQWVAGWEVSGIILIQAEANICPDNPLCICVAQQSTEILVPTTEDGCHVQTQYLNISFEHSDIVEEICVGEEDTGEE
jgi:hypothetical protein